MSTATIFGPLLVIVLAVALSVTGQWRLIAPVTGLTVGLALIGLGVGSFVGALWQWPAPTPGANPFQKGNNGGLPSLLSFCVTMLGTIALAFPTVVLVIGSFWIGWLGYLALGVGLATGLVVLRIGIRLGGKMLERRWPEVMLAVSERTG